MMNLEQTLVTASNITSYCPAFPNQTLQVTEMDQQRCSCYKLGLSHRSCGNDWNPCFSFFQHIRCERASWKYTNVSMKHHRNPHNRDLGVVKGISNAPPPFYDLRYSIISHYFPRKYDKLRLTSITAENGLIVLVVAFDKRQRTLLGVELGCSAPSKACHFPPVWHCDEVTDLFINLLSPARNINWRST